MFVRFVTLRIKPGMETAFVRFYKAELAPSLLKQDGCMFAHLIESMKHESEFVSLTFWQSREHASEFEDGGKYAELVESNRPFLADSSEWRMQLTEDLTLSYQPVPAEPEVERFEVQGGITDDVPDDAALSEMYLRIVAAHTNPDKIDELRRVYQEIIVPVLKATPGCRYAYMAAGRHDTEMLSVTLWDSKALADAYESSGKFDELMKSVRPWLSSLTQWRLSLGSEKQARTATSDDVQVVGFRVAG